MGSWTAGMCMNIVGSVCINLGQNLWKLSHKRADEAQAKRLDHKRPSNRKSNTYRAGMGLFIVGNALNFISMSLAAQTLLSGLGAIQFVTNIIFGRYVLLEVVTWRMVFATGLIVAGNIQMVIFANHNSPDRTVDDLLALYRVSLYLFYLIFQVALCTGVYFFNRWARRVCPARKNIHAASYALLAGIIGAQSVVFGKQESELCKNWITGVFSMNQVPFAVGVTIAWGATITFWIVRMNRGLREFDGTIIVPLLQISWTFFATQGSAVYFREYSSMPLHNIMWYHMGLLVTLSGVFVLTTGPSRMVSPDEEEELSLAAVDRSRLYVEPKKELDEEAEALALQELEANTRTQPSEEGASSNPVASGDLLAKDVLPPEAAHEHEHGVEEDKVVIISTEALVDQAATTTVEVDKKFEKSLALMRRSAGTPGSKRTDGRSPMVNRGSVVPSEDEVPAPLTSTTSPRTSKAPDPIGTIPLSPPWPSCPRRIVDGRSPLMARTQLQSEAMGHPRSSPLTGSRTTRTSADASAPAVGPSGAAAPLAAVRSNSGASQHALAVASSLLAPTPQTHVETTIMRNVSPDVGGATDSPAVRGKPPPLPLPLSAAHRELELIRLEDSDSPSSDEAGPAIQEQHSSPDANGERVQKQAAVRRPVCNKQLSQRSQEDSGPSSPHEHDSDFDKGMLLTSTSSADSADSADSSNSESRTA